MRSRESFAAWKLPHQSTVLNSVPDGRGGSEGGGEGIEIKPGKGEERNVGGSDGGKEVGREDWGMEGGREGWMKGWMEGWR